MNKQPDVTAATKKRMTAAFFEIYKTKRIEKISVNEITRLSGNNRSTFYNYFTDVYDLLDQLENDLLDDVVGEIEEAIRSAWSENGKQIDISNMYSTVSPVFFKYEEMLYTLLGPDGDPKFADMLKGRVTKDLMEFSPFPIDSRYIDYLGNYIYCSMVGMLTYWHEKDHNISQDEFLHLAQTLTARGTLGFIEDETKGNNHTENECLG